MTREVRGAGGGGKGGGGSGRVAQEAPDSLRSKAYAKVLDLICEGEIEGLVDGAASIYLDDTPLQNDDGSYNFSGVIWEQRTGTQQQDYIGGFSEVENTVSVGVEVKAATPVVRQFTNPNLDAVEVTIGIPVLQQQNTTNGDVNGTSVSVSIDLQSNGGGFVPVPLRQVWTSVDAVTNPFSVTGEGIEARVQFKHAQTTQGLLVVYSPIQYLVEFQAPGSGVWATLESGTIPAPTIATNANTLLWFANAAIYASGKDGSVSRTFQKTGSQGTWSMRISVVSGGSITSVTGQRLTRIGSLEISGKTSSRYQRTVRIPLTGSPPWDIRVNRLTADSTSQALQNKTWWDSYTEVIEAKLRYPNSAMVGLVCDASQFSNIPRRAYDVRLLRVRVPSNYDPATRVYTGSWDGTFQIAWTDNPAWCFYDLVTSDRYGLGEFIDATQVDKWALYSIGRYCDELVPDGAGGAEPRFTCNIYLQSREEAYKVVNDFVSIFRGLAFWSSGAITAIQDAPADAAALFNQANVIDGSFSYSGSSAKARHTVALVTWNDPADFYKQKVEYVEDRDGIARYGVVTTEIAAIGCTSQGQAHRVGRWLLYSERLESETVSFRTSLEGMTCRPGQVIKVADPSRAGIRMGGRIVTATTSLVQVDSPVTLTAGQAYTLSALKNDGTVMESTVSHSGGMLSTLNLSPALPQAPAVGSVWILSTSAVVPQTFRVLTVVENDKHEFEVLALAHDPSKYAAVEQNLALTPRTISLLSEYPATPTELAVSEGLYQTAQGVRSRATVSWAPVASATSYAVTYQRDGGNLSPEIVTTTPAVDLQELVEGLYTFSVVAINGIGKRSTTPATVSYQLLGKTAPPENVQGFVVARNGDTLNFSWRHVGDVDLDHYEIRQGLSWNTGIVIGSTVSNAFSWSAPRGGVFMIKAVDTTGNYSASESAVQAADLSGINVVLSSSETARAWNGTTSNAIVLGITQPVSWSDLNTWNDTTTWDATTFSGGVALNGSQPWSAYTQPWSSYTKPWLFLDGVSSGTYTTQPIDIGFKATSTVYLENLIETLQLQGPWESFTEPWTYYAAPEWTWQGRASGIAASFEISTSDDNVTWSQWAQFTPGAYTFRYVRIRATLTTSDPNIIPYMTRLIVRIDVPDRVLHFGNVAIPIAGATLSFSPAFVGVQTVQVTLQSAASGDRFTVTGKGNSSVTVNIFDSAGAAKAGTADVDVFGYGERF